MSYELQRRISMDINLKRFLMENSFWYKELNRNDNSFSLFVHPVNIISGINNNSFFIYPPKNNFLIMHLILLHTPLEVLL